MAEEGAKIDFPAHERTYSGFIGLFKYGTVVAAAAVVLVILVIT